MSQIFKAITGNIPLPPDIPTQFTTDDGVAIPAANNLNVLGQNGIVTSADPNGSDNLIISIQNTQIDTGQTIGATTINLSTIPLGAAGTYFFECRVVAYEASTPLGGGYSTFTTFRTDGVTAVVIGDTDAIEHVEGALDDTVVEMVGSGNSALLQVTGVAGLTIDWGAVSLYIYRG
jgi:hypothetical protein